MTSAGGPGSTAAHEMPSRARLRGRWRVRPPIYSRPVWALMLALDGLPWPWGEDIQAGLAMIAGAARRSRWRRAVAWASAQPTRHPRRLAAALCAFRGRWGARARLLGVRDLDEVRRHVVLEGENHLTSIRGGAILLAFHLGPPGGEAVLRLLGHRVTWLGWGDRARAGWWRPALQPLFEPTQHAFPAEDARRWPALLYRARRVLLEGGIVYLFADGRGRELFRVPLPGCPVIVRAGWVSLRRHTGVPILPILTHLEGRIQVVTIHPALPTSESDPVEELARWRERLTELLTAYVQRFPEQCIALAFGEER